MEALAEEDASKESENGDGGVGEGTGKCNAPEGTSLPGDTAVVGLRPRVIYDEDNGDVGGRP